MKLTTRCPSCGTAYRIYPEQLEAREGHVRCGQCSTVFDARAALLSEPESNPAPFDQSSFARAEEIAQVEAVVAQEVAPSLPPAREISLAESESDFDFGPRLESRLSAGLWTVGCFSLVLLLALQLGFVYRGELATRAPALRPWLQAVCRPLGCTVPLVGYANLISIESSELAAERGATGLFTLVAVLRNRAAFTQAHPALELTLTDLQDRPLARRVLAPKDYLEDVSVRDAGFAGNSEYNLRVHIDAAELGAAGYRLYAFYE
jgi:predicted Zn finger-like uncharacterized protein